MKDKLKSYFFMQKDFINNNKNPFVAGIFAIILGMFGAQRFYLNRKISACICLALTIAFSITQSALILSVVFIIYFLAIAEGLLYTGIGMKMLFIKLISNQKKLGASAGSLTVDESENHKKHSLEQERPMVKDSIDIDNYHNNAIVVESIKLSVSGQKNGEYADSFSKHIVKKNATSRFEDRPLAQRLAEYKKNKMTREICYMDEGKSEIRSSAATNKPENKCSPEIIDVSEIETTEIVANESRHTTNSQNNDWIQQLSIPYERSVMRNKQIKEETLRIYNELCSYVDGQLSNEKKSLKREVRRVASKGGHYDNLLYTFYCIAEGHVTKGYGGHYSYDYEYSYGILKNHLGAKLKDITYQKALELESSLSFPSPETQREFYLTTNGLPIVWWDKDGMFRAGTSLDKQNISILNATLFRDTKIWNLLDVKKEMLLLYLSLWGIIRTNLDKGLKWKKTSIANVEKIVQGKYSYSDYNERTGNFLSALLKISEGAVRDLLPKSAYTQSLNLENDWHLVKLFLPKEIVEEIIVYISSYKDNITQETIYALVSALADSEAVNPRIIAEKLRLSSSEQWLGVFAAQQDKSDYDKYLREIIKVSENNDLLLLASYELARIDKMPLATLKKAKQIIYKENIGAFESLIEKKEPLSATLLNQMLELKNPIRKRIRLDSAQIEQSKRELTQTVEILSEFIPEEELPVPPEKNVTVVPAEEEIFVHEDSPFAIEVEKMLMRILEKGFIPSEEVKEIALTQGKLLGTYINDLNKEFYEYVGDQLLLVDEDTVKIDGFYIDLARELLKHEN